MATFYGHKCLKQAFNIDLAQIYPLQTDFKVNAPPKLAFESNTMIAGNVTFPFHC